MSLPQAGGAEAGPDGVTLEQEDGAVKGLSTSEAALRAEHGGANSSSSSTSRSLLEIVRANVLTRFNALLGGLLVVILVVGPLQDALFGVILVVNTAIGVFQEVRARRTLDRLALLNEPRARVLRDGVPKELAREEVVLGDVVQLRRGDQVVADGEVVEASGLELDESLLSGEAESVARAAGEPVLSGSAVVAGSALMRVTAVGEGAFAQGLAAEARRFSLVRSELQEANNRILRLVTFAIVPVTALLCWSQLSGTLGVKDALRGSVAGVANMIPEGLVLLTSIAYGVGALRLARRRVLVRELAAVEGLARVDVLCIDKTGTLTTGRIRPVELRVIDPDFPVRQVIAGLAAAEGTPTASLQGLAELAGEAPALACSDHVPFSSQRRFSGADFGELGFCYLGAPEAFLRGAGAGREGLDAEIAAEAALGHRVLLLARASSGPAGGRPPAGARAVALGVLAEEVRPDAAELLSYLREQGVAVKVISGDSPATVAAIAARAGMAAGAAVDAEALPGEADELAALMEQRAVFGRVGPREKRAMVAALQSAGHVVAMTGDGVNDVLALRDADLGIAMGSGSPAARAAGRVVLLDDAFSILPKLLGEGRRVLANVERVSKLFVTKTVYATLLAVSIGIARLPYPFYPRDLTVISSLTIGIPAFFLALPPASTRLRSGYLRRVFSFTAPVGSVLAAATLVTYLLDRLDGGGTAHARTAALLVLGTTGLFVLGRLSRPLSWWKLALVASMAGLFALVLAVPLGREILALTTPSSDTLLLWAVVSGAAVALLEVLWRLPLLGVRERPEHEEALPPDGL